MSRVQRAERAIRLTCPCRLLQPVIVGEGKYQDVSVTVKEGKRLVLFVKDGGDGFENDHALG